MTASFSSQRQIHLNETQIARRVVCSVTGIPRFKKRNGNSVIPALSRFSFIPQSVCKTMSSKILLMPSKTLNTFFVCVVAKSAALRFLVFTRADSQTDCPPDCPSDSPTDATTDSFES
jgi:hypothetical protein